MKHLGPFAFALHVVLSRAENYREDRQTPGNIITQNEQLVFTFKSTLGFFEGSFIAFKGIQMLPVWLQPWLDSSSMDYEKCIQTTSILTFNSNLKVALSQATAEKACQIAQFVVFVLVLRNHSPFLGFRLTQHIHSAYAHEQEVVLREGLRLNVLGSEQVLVANKAKDFVNFD